MSGLRSTRVRRLAGVAAVLGVLALLSTACTTPSTPNPNQPGGSSFTFRATRAEVVSHNDSFLQGTRDEPFVYNVWFRVKLGVPNSAQVGVAGSRDSASMSLGNGESRYLFSDAEQGAVRFDNVRLVDAGDLLNPQNHLEVVGSWTWAMEEDNISVKGLTDKTAQILKNTLNSTLATMSLPSDTGALVSQIMGSIPQAFLFFAGAAFASIPGLSDDVVGSNIYAGVGATGTLASVLDAATESFKLPFIEIPIVSIPPDIGLNPGGGATSSPWRRRRRSPARTSRSGTRAHIATTCRWSPPARRSTSARSTTPAMTAAPTCRMATSMAAGSIRGHATGTGDSPGC